MDAKKLKYIDKLITGQLEDNRIAGAGVYVFKDGEYLVKKQYGYADKENKIPMAENTIFKMFSCTKPITATALMILFERGELELEYPVSRFLPSFSHMKVVSEDGTLTDCKTEITIRDLLNMTSGLVYPGGWFEAGRHMEPVFEEIMSNLYTPDALTTRQAADLIATAPLMHEPGRQWNYGTSADVLGAVIEVVSGQSLRDFIKSEILDPLGMNDTDFYVPLEKQNRFAKLYEPYEGGIRPYDYTYLGITNCLQPPKFESGGAGIVSTAPDYMKFLRMLLGGGKADGVQILSKGTVRLMTQNHMTADQYNSMQFGSTRGCGYGCFMRVIEDVAQATTNGDAGEYGWDGWSGTYFSVNPARNMIILYLIQRCGTGCDDMTKRLRQIIYSAI